MGLPGSYRLARRSSDFGRFPTEGAVSAKEAGDRHAERRSLAEGARKPAKQNKTRYRKTGLNEEDCRYGTQQSETGGSHTIGRGARRSGCSAERAVHPDSILPDGRVRSEWRAVRKRHGRLLQSD